ncbi:MAG: DNA polymerase I [Pseudomonadota bacterium]
MHKTPITHIVLIDAMSLFFRAYHAVRPLNRADGLPTNALFGFAQMLDKVVNDLAPTHCAVISDSPPPNWRHHLYSAYKANRPEPDDAMKAQFPYLEPLVQAFGLPLVRQQGMEADDLIASAVAQLRDPNARITIVTSDKDLLQLVCAADANGPEVRLFDSMKDAYLGPEAAVAKFGVGPEKVLEVQALMGDSSDNIPGIAGVGPKTAADLVQQFGDLEGLYARVGEIARENLREKIVAGREAAFLSRELASLKRDVPVDAQSWAFTPTLTQAAQYLEETLEFRTLGKRLRERAAKHSAAAVAPVFTAPAAGLAWGPYEAVTTLAQWQVWREKLKAVKVFAFDTETTSLNPRQARLVGVSFAVSENEACYIPIAPLADAAASQTGDLFAPQGTTSPSGPHGVEGLDLREDLRALLADPTLIFVGHNLKYDAHIIEAYCGAHIGAEGAARFEDTLLMAQTMLPPQGGFGLDNLAKTLLGHTMIAFTEVAGKGKTQVTFDAVALDVATAYAAEDADATLRLYQHLSALPASTVYAEIERPLLPVLVRMESTGVCVDAAYLRELSGIMALDLATREAEIHKQAGHVFNVQSTQQLAVVLFDELGAGSEKQKKARSTAVEVLESLAEAEGPAQKIAQEMVQYRQTQKLRSTYTEALLNQIEPSTGRVHTHYQQLGASTGRFSSSDPKVQNIPIRTAAGRQVRQAFVPRSGWQMVSADYSQIELRLLAHLSGSKALSAAFTEGLDIHTYTASLVAGVPQSDVTKEQRRAAKFINFGLVYGMGARSLAQQIGCSMSEAQSWIEAYFNRYDGVRDYMELNKRQVKERGYVETLLGRKVWLPDINSPNAGLRAGAERAAINAPLQGSNADIIKLAMVQVHKALNPMHAAMLLQVHDELVLEAAPAAVENLKILLPKLMGGVVQLNVPLLVEVGVGPNWDAAH